MKYCLMGMPNVGKSSIFNRLCNKNISIIEDKDHTTIDYISYAIGHDILTDTCGLNSAKDIIGHMETVVLNSDVILYVIRGDVGLRDTDYEIINFLRRKKKEIYCLVNFSDKANFIPLNGGFSKIYHISAVNKIELDFLNGKASFNNPKAIIGLIGKTNVGKSSLLNSLVNKYRSVVKDQLNTTKDSVFEEIENLCYIDTAGYCNINDFMANIIEKRRQQSLQYVSGLVVVLDYNQPITSLDKKCLNYAYTHNLFTIICFNKCDLKQYDQLKLDIPPWIPIVYVSAKNNNTKQLTRTINRCLNVNTEINTKQLNQLFTKHKSQLVMRDNTQCNIKYITQTHNKPIGISYFGSKALSDHSAKFLKKQIALHFKLIGQRIKLIYVKKHNIYI